MSQPLTNSNIPPELRLDFTSLAEDILALQFDELATTNIDSGPDPALDNVALPASSRSATSSTAITDLIRRLNQAREDVRRAEAAVRKLTACDLDLEAQQNLLLATSTSCITKRQLICLLKRELSKFSKDTSSNSFDSL
ncbi:unnamed protein product [Dicrocoelium dendriticum]|nr:unnamed protein product [Dicrocoelium dendriticum]